MSTHQFLDPAIRRMRLAKRCPSKAERLERTAAAMRARRIEQGGRGRLPRALKPLDSARAEAERKA